ncbi:FUSC family protein [Rhodococcus sp. NPDC059234]|uniref:FUSC family protein n=1 Tax=Rhodococcus sp. NPDC059234 TaxID=3346781 RepID=UPI00366CA53A
MSDIRCAPSPIPETPADTNEHLHASRVAIGLVVPGLALVIAGRPDLIVYAVFGSFTGMYGRSECHRERLRHQLQASGVLLTGVAIGVLLSGIQARPWMLVVTEVGFAAVGSVVTDRCGLRPAGPFFGIFALGAIAVGPAGHVAPWAALAIYAGTALLSIVVGQSRSIRGRALGRGTAARPVRADGQPDTSEVLIQAARYALALSIAGVIGLLLGIGHLNWALAGAAVPLAATDARSRVYRGIHRVLGTLAGLAATAALLLPDLSATVLAVFVIALLFPTELFMTRNYGLAIGFFTPLIMLMTELAYPTEPMTLIRDRVIGTLLGVAAGVAVAVTTHRSRGAPAVD